MADHSKCQATYPGNESAAPVTGPRFIPRSSSLLVFLSSNFVTRLDVQTPKRRELPHLFSVSKWHLRCFTSRQGLGAGSGARARAANVRVRGRHFLTHPGQHRPPSLHATGSNALYPSFLDPERRRSVDSFGDGSNENGAGAGVRAAADSCVARGPAAPARESSHYGGATPRGACATGTGASGHSAAVTSSLTRLRYVCR